MATLYDIYPHSTEALPEFRQMMEFPSQTDTLRFADAAMQLLGPESSNAKFRREGDQVYRYRDFVFHEGMLGISEVAYTDPSEELTPLGFDVELTVAQQPDEFTLMRNIVIRTGYSEQQITAAKFFKSFRSSTPVHQAANFDEPPRLIDLGIINLDDPQIAGPLASMPAVDRSRAPSGLDIQPGTLSEDLAMAEFKDQTEDHVDKLIETGALEELFAGSAYVPEIQHSVVSKITLRRLTRFLMALENNPSA